MRDKVSDSNYNNFEKLLFKWYFSFNLFVGEVEIKCKFELLRHNSARNFRPELPCSAWQPCQAHSSRLSGATSRVSPVSRFCSERPLEWTGKLHLSPDSNEESLKNTFVNSYQTKQMSHVVLSLAACIIDRIIFLPNDWLCQKSIELLEDKNISSITS